MYFTDAEEAFKRLSVAYECLCNESSQRSYIRTLLTTRSLHQAPKRPPPPSSYAPSAYPRKKKQKKSDKPPPPARDTNSVPPPPPPSSAPRRQRTPEETWKQFQDEEERMARKEFMSRGFERTYASSGSRNAGSGDDPEKPQVDSAVHESIMSSDLHAKAHNWSSWKKNASSQTAPPSTEPSTNPRETEDASKRRGSVTKAEPEEELIYCLLCRRKFPTHETLSRHKSYSTLHLTNLQRAQTN